MIVLIIYHLIYELLVLIVEHQYLLHQIGILDELDEVLYVYELGDTDDNDDDTTKTEPDIIDFVRNDILIVYIIV